MNIYWKYHIATSSQFSILSSIYNVEHPIDHGNFLLCFAVVEPFTNIHQGYFIGDNYAKLLSEPPAIEQSQRILESQLHDSP